MLNAMQSAGLPCPEILYADGELYRFGQSKSCWYILFESDGIRAGAFGCWRLGISENWSSKSLREFSPDERRAYAKQIEAAKRLREAEQANVQAECREWCARAWKECQPADPQHPYLVRKKIKPYGIKQLEDALLVPLSSAGVIHGIQFIKPDGEKRFKVGTAKQGNCFKIGDLTDTVVICEGFATGASIHEATGYCVLVAFDAGNLKAVAEMAKAKLSGRDLIIAADNDAWAKIRDKEGNVIEHRPVPCVDENGRKCVNTGIVKAKECGLPVIVPQFKDVSTFPTDFNDLHCLEGLDQVRWGFSPKDEEPPPMDDGDYCEYPQAGEAVELPDEPAAAVKFDLFGTAPFQLLGYDHSDYYYLSNGTGQVKSLRAGEHTKANLMTLATLNWWEGLFNKDTKGKGFDEDMAKNAMIQTSHARGIYDMDRVRGLGAWEDAGKSVLHLGDYLLVDNKKIALPDFKSKFIYERALSMSDEDAEPLGSTEANRLVQLCEMLSWERPINGKLLAGWCVAAVICGGLKWRPHLWVTGPSGTGKTWIISNIVKFITGNFLKGMLGTTTEPGMRRAIGNNAFSVFFDEFEAEDPDAGKRIQSILEFARPCSSNEDSKIYKAKQGGEGVDSFQPRACIGMASVNVNMKQRADTSRVTVLTLTKGKEGVFDNQIEPFWIEHFTPEFARGVRARAISMIPTINKNAEIFQRAMTEKLGGRREGDQYGALLACCYSMFSNSVISLQQAREFVLRQNWDGHTSQADQTDERRCLAAIMEHLVRVDSGETFNVAELITMASGSVMDNTCLAAQATLQRYGIKFVEGGFAISNTHSAISKMLEKTPWSSNWGRILGRLEGATKPPAGIWIGGGTSRVVMLPLRYAREE